MVRIPTLKSRIPTLDTRTAKPLPKKADSFLHTSEWEKARDAALLRDGGHRERIPGTNKERVVGAHCTVPGCGRVERRMFVDHIKERKDGGALLDLANLQTLCGSHHTTKTLAVRSDRMKS